MFIFHIFGITLKNEYIRKLKKNLKFASPANVLKVSDTFLKSSMFPC